MAKVILCVAKLPSWIPRLNDNVYVRGMSEFHLKCECQIFTIPFKRSQTHIISFYVCGDNGFVPYTKKKETYTFSIELD